MTELLKAISPILSALKDPLLILLFLVVIGQFYLILLCFKGQEAKDKIIADLRVCLDTNLAELNETTVKLVTLVEFLVYGKKGGR